MSTPNRTLRRTAQTEAKHLRVHTQEIQEAAAAHHQQHGPPQYKKDRQMQHQEPARH